MLYSTCFNWIDWYNVFNTYKQNKDLCFIHKDDGGVDNNNNDDDDDDDMEMMMTWFLR